MANGNNAKGSGTNAALTLKEAGAYMAGLEGRDRPYPPATVRALLERGELSGRQEDEVGKTLVLVGGIKDWARQRGLLAPAAPASNPAAPTPAPAAAPKAAQPKAAGQAEEKSGRFKLVPLDDGEDAADGLVFGWAECPSCHGAVPVSMSAVTAECPTCQTMMQVEFEDEDEEDEAEDGDELPAAKLAVARTVQSEGEPAGNPSWRLFGPRGRRGR